MLDFKLGGSSNESSANISDWKCVNLSCQCTQNASKTMLRKNPLDIFSDVLLSADAELEIVDKKVI